MSSYHCSGTTVARAKPRKIPAITILFVLLDILAALAAHGAPSGAAVSPERPEKIRLQLNGRHDFQFAGYYAAIEKGFFHIEGVDVELIEGGPDVNPTENLLAGKADLAIASPTFIIRRQQDPSLILLAAIFQRSPTEIVFLKGSGLSTPQSLAGKRVMLAPDAGPEVRAMLMAEELPLQSIEFFPYKHGLEDLLAGRVDAQAISVDASLFDKKNAALTSIKPFDYGINFYGGCVISTKANVRNRSNQIEGFLQATKIGWKYALDHPEEVARIIKSRYAPDLDLEQLLREAEAIRELIGPDLTEIGHMNPERWAHTANIFVKLKMLKDYDNLQDFFYSDYRDRLAAQKKQWKKFAASILTTVVLLSLFAGLVLFFFNRRLSDEIRQRTLSLVESEQHFRTLFEMAGVGVTKISIEDGGYERMNKKYCDIVGFTQEELFTRTFFDITHPEDLDDQIDQLKDLEAGKIKEFTMEKRYVKKNGQIIWADLTASPLWHEGEKPEYCLGIVRDVTLLKRAEEKLVFAAKVFENSIEGIIVTDARGSIMQVNPAFSKITGYSPEEAIGNNPRILKSKNHTPEFYAEMWTRLLGDGQWSGEIWNRRKNGGAYPEWLTISAVKNNFGKITNYVSIFHDITDLKQQQEALRYQAEHDALTGLPNRVLINDRLEMALTRTKRKPTKLALLYLDLDNFKHINDAFGYAAGDRLLIEAAERISRILRSSDTLARLGGDEFLIFINEMENIDEISLVAVRIINCLKNPFYHEESEYLITVSIGVAIAPEDGTDAVTLIKYAESAMYEAKSLGRNNYQFFTPELGVQAHQLITMGMKMRKGLDRGDFELYYQPIIHMSSGKIAGAEALIRWRDDGKLISPRDFIPLAEDSGLILPLGEWVLKTAVRQARIWQEAGYNLGISVNISPHQFAGRNLLGLLLEVLREERSAPGRLYFEITESMIMRDVAKAQKIMGDIRRQGIKFYLDDFGTGYSSLSYLKRLPIDGLKIDHSFIKDIVDDPESRAIVAVIVSLAQILDLTVVAEGVETKAQWRLLNAMGDMLLQGYLASPPLPAREFEVLLKKGRIRWQAASSSEKNTISGNRLNAVSGTGPVIGWTAG
jgi:diguanylate cyclase (GGDEF)-like protein/PAS domain S-box-containing protein